MGGWNRNRLLALIALLGVVAALLITGGCRGDRTNKPPRQFFPGLDDQPKYKVQSESHFFKDGRTMRMPPAGAVAFGRRTEFAFGSSAKTRSESARKIGLERAALLREDDAVFRGVSSDGSYVERIPLATLFATPSGEQTDPALFKGLIERGQGRFNIFCYPCHGALGNGKGPVGVRWSGAGPADLTQERLRPGGENGQDGYLFSIAQNGLPNADGQEPAFRMQGYSAQIDAYDTWAIVAYVRVLQRARAATIEKAPESERQNLMRSKPKAEPAPTEGEATP